MERREREGRCRGEVRAFCETDEEARINEREIDRQERGLECSDGKRGTSATAASGARARGSSRTTATAQKEGGRQGRETWFGYSRTRGKKERGTNLG